MAEMPRDVGHRTALVTGSSNGIGEAIVKRLAELDYKLVVTGRNGPDIKRVADECELLSPTRMRPLEVIANLEFEEDVVRLFKSSLDHFGQRLDLLVNNAGLTSTMTSQQQIGASERYEDFKRIIMVNLNSACQLSLLAAEPLKRTSQLYCANRPTSIVNISSIAAIKPLEDFAYCVSKCGLSMLSNCLAGQLGPAVRVNCINPGPIETKIIERAGTSLDSFRAVAERMTPLRRMGHSNEVADAVVFLSDPERASYITGAQLSIDGGVLCSMIKF
jgi:glucose 1-dehydrogenase